MFMETICLFFETLEPGTPEIMIQQAFSNACHFDWLMSVYGEIG